MQEIKTADYLGYMALDTVTGFKGTVTAITFYLVGNTRVELTSIKSSGGGKAESEWFDITSILMSKVAMRHRITDINSGESEWFDESKKIHSIGRDA